MSAQEWRPRAEPGLKQIADATRAAVLTRFHPDSCIATTRAVIEVARYYGVPAAPWAVDMTVTAGRARELSDAGVPTSEWPDDAWSIGMRADPAARPGDGGEFGVGHVVAIARWAGLGQVLIDASIDQVARPGRIPHISPLVAPLPADFDASRPRETVAWEMAAAGVEVWYRGNGSRLYTTSPHWRRSDPIIRAVVAAAIRAIRAGDSVTAGDQAT